MATFGYTTAGGSSGSYVVDCKHAVNAVLAEAASSVTKVTWYIRNDGGACNARAAIYQDSSGSPGALVAQSNAVAIALGASVAWVDFAFATPFSLAAGTYWICLVADGGNVRVYWDSASGYSFLYADDTYSDGYEDPFGAFGNNGAYRLSAYVTYTAAVAGNPAYYYAQL